MSRACQGRHSPRRVPTDRARLVSVQDPLEARAPTSSLVPLGNFARLHPIDFAPDAEFVLMAAAPGAPFILQLTSKALEQRALGAGLLLAEQGGRLSRLQIGSAARCKNRGRHECALDGARPTPRNSARA
jgi:hypothetical protein